MDLIERVLYKAALIVSGCWQGTSRERLYKELGWESLSNRRWARRLTIFYKINNGLAPSYLSNYIPQRNEISVDRRSRIDSTPFVRPRYENSFYPYTTKRWKELDDDYKSQPSVQSFKKHLNDFIRPLCHSLGHSLFGICDKYGTKLLTKIRVNFSDLRGHRFNHNFNCDNPLLSCGVEDETSVHFFLRCPHYVTQRSSLLSKISVIISSDVTVFPDVHLYHILDHGSNVYNSVSNGLIETITYIRNSERFTDLEAFREIHFIPPPPPPP